MATQHVTTEGTKKKYKAQILLSIFALCVGIALAVAGADGYEEGQKVSATTMAGIYVSAAAFAWYAIVKAVIWWNHA